MTCAVESFFLSITDTVRSAINHYFCF